MKSYIAFARIVPKTEHFNDAKEAILGIIPKTLNEQGCHVFTLHEAGDKNDPALYLYEVWEDKNAFKFHHEQEYTKEVFKSYKNWLAEPVEIKQLEKVS
ncbi:MAG: putative quinol monooxygenase [Thermodesulfobacteriota bacterium]